MGGVEPERRIASIRSPVNWTLLGLIIERPSYAYELSQRFERIYGDALSLSSASHAYRVLGTLKDRGLIEEIPGTRTGRQPRPHYRATPTGVSAYHDWLIGQVAEERRRQKVFLLQLTALTDPRDLHRALALVDDYEQACLSETCSLPVRTPAPGRSSRDLDLQTRLIAEEKRLATGARVSWARFARSELKAAADARAGAGVRTGNQSDAR